MLSQAIFAQKEAANWFFGNVAGLDFNSGTPVVVDGGQTGTIEGVATISNSNGNLLFYTDGITVWNRHHQAMPLGTGLHGHTSSTQSAIIVPKIGDTNRYYVFTIDDYGSPQRLQYSIVNMNLDSGRGDLEAKNVHIISGVSEKLTAVRHCNQRDFWIITHTTLSNTYYAFLVDPSGVHTVPVVSNTGISYQYISIGYLKASPDGRKLAAASWLQDAEISDFDNTTGIVSNTYSLIQTPSDTTYRVYGVEFSPNGKLVYVSGLFETPPWYWGDILLQFDVTLSNPAAIRASRQMIARHTGISTFGALQIAIDGKMYLAKADIPEIAAINNPNVYGPGCNYVASAVQFTSRHQKSMHGLPNFIQSLFFKRGFSFSVECPGNRVNFQKEATRAGESFTWDFDDPASGANNTSTLETPTHVFASDGPHTVRLITFTPCGPDTISHAVQTQKLILDLGPDTLICGDNSIQLNAGSGNNSFQYLWQDGTSNSTFPVTTPGIYWAEIKDTIGCVTRDTIIVNYDKKPTFTLGPDQYVCPGYPIFLNPSLNPSWQLQWQDGTTNPDYTVTQPGQYQLRASNGCGVVADEILVYKGVCKIYVPTGFTPNGDGKNDLFKILGAETLQRLHLVVFNRWGEIVFETRDKSKGWDGFFRGKLAPVGNYVYLLEYKDDTSVQLQNMKGNFILIQ